MFSISPPRPLRLFSTLLGYSAGKRKIYLGGTIEYKTVKRLNVTDHHAMSKYPPVFLDIHLLVHREQLPAQIPITIGVQQLTPLRS
jgi:hypothetical protein